MTFLQEFRSAGFTRTELIRTFRSPRTNHPKVTTALVRAQRGRDEDPPNPSRPA